MKTVGWRLKIIIVLFIIILQSFLYVGTISTSIPILLSESVPEKVKYLSLYILHPMFPETKAPPLSVYEKGTYWKKLPFRDAKKCKLLGHNNRSLCRCRLPRGVALAQDCTRMRYPRIIYVDEARAEHCTSVSNPRRMTLMCA